jgi:pentatricopeptide repeat protein
MTPDKIHFFSGDLRYLLVAEQLKMAGLFMNSSIQGGCKSDVFVGSSLVYMYAKSGIVQDPWRVFNKMPSQDVVISSAMVLGHVQCGQGQMVLELFQQMQQEGVQPHSVTFVGFLKCCGI